MKADKTRFIEIELRQFKRKYWLSKLLQGILVFCGTGLVWIGLISLVEYFTWLSSAQRAWLFSSTAIIETILFLIYIGWPALQLVGNGQALSDKKAADLIGKELPGVEDKLTNYLELRERSQESDLVFAGLNQKQSLLSVFRFTEAIKLSALRPFLLFLVPVLILLLFLVTGNRWSMLAEGAERLVNFNTEYQRELPFNIAFGSELEVDEGKDFELTVTTTGVVIPEELEVQSSLGRRVLSRDKNNTYKITFQNCVKEIPFRIVYDEIESEQYILHVHKKAVVGRITVEVTPPDYTQINPFTVENSAEVELPENSQVVVKYAFKNVDKLVLYQLSTSYSDTSLVEQGSKIQLKPRSNTKLLTNYNGKELSRTSLNVIKDHRPELDVRVDTVAGGLNLSISASDDYSIRSARAVLVEISEEETGFQLPHQGALLKANIPISSNDLEFLSSVKISVSDHLGTTQREIDLSAFKKKEETEKELLNEAGSNIASLIEEKEDPNQERDLSRQKSEQKKKADEISKTAKQLSRKDSIQYQRFEQLSEEILKLAEEMEQNIPEARKKMKEKKMDELIAELEKEWLVLQTIEQLKTLEDSLKLADKPIDKKQMNELQKTGTELKEKSKDDANSENVEWQKFSDLEKKNSELEKKAGESDKAGDESEDGEKDEKKEDSLNDQDQKPGSKDIKKEMMEDSESLREQLAGMSDIMMMETTQKNIELIRRLELRSLKSSQKQEDVYKKTSNQNEVPRSLAIAQKEVTQSATNILDSLSALTISDPMMAKVLMENQLKLDEHIAASKGIDPGEVGAFLSSQRYLQYGLNDLAALLYDLLKAESESLMNMKGGSKNCNNPKPGKGKKPSLSSQQKSLGEKLGKMPKPGKGKPGKQTMSQGEILDIIKGQEQILEQYKQQGGDKAGEGELAEEMNKQLDDLINMNLDKALERNKNIEDKLITLEESDNMKKDQKDKRESKENKLDYDQIKNAALQNYLKTNQKGSSIVNLPALKNYFTSKWVTINQE